MSHLYLIQTVVGFVLTIAAPSPRKAVEFAERDGHKAVSVTQIG